MNESLRERNSLLFINKKASKSKDDTVGSYSPPSLALETCFIKGDNNNSNNSNSSNNSSNNSKNYPDDEISCDEKPVDEDSVDNEMISLPDVSTCAAPNNLRHRTSPAVSQSIVVSLSQTSELRGGRLWKLAGEMAQHQQEEEKEEQEHEQYESSATQQHAAALSNKDRVPNPYYESDEDHEPTASSSSSSSSSMDPGTSCNTRKTPATIKIANHRRSPFHRMPAWTETFMERTRSRATPDADAKTLGTLSPCSAASASGVIGPGSAVLMKIPNSCAADDTEHETTMFLVDTSVAQKRVKVAQLLLAGLVGILIGWLGNAVVGTSCHFASVQVPVGQNGDYFALHFGLYKYSTVDSSLNG